MLQEISLKPNQFMEFIRTKEDCFLDFYSESCNPCRILLRRLEKYNKDIYKMNIDTNFELCDFLGITSVPTVLKIKNGIEEKRLVGLVDEKELI